MTKELERPEKELVSVGLDVDRTLGYIDRIHCNNCNWFDTIYIPYGITIKQYLKDKRCKRCNCEGVLY